MKTTEQALLFQPLLPLLHFPSESRCKPHSILSLGLPGSLLEFLFMCVGCILLHTLKIENMYPKCYHAHSLVSLCLAIYLAIVCLILKLQNKLTSDLFALRLNTLTQNVSKSVNKNSHNFLNKNRSHQQLLQIQIPFILLASTVVTCDLLSAR